VDAKGPGKMTPLHNAAAARAAVTVVLPRSHGALLNTKNIYRKTLFNSAFKMGDPSLFHILYENLKIPLDLQTLESSNLLLHFPPSTASKKDHEEATNNERGSTNDPIRYYELLICIFRDNIASPPFALLFNFTYFSYFLLLDQC
jgi:ankyrin repeat protein